MTNIQHLDLLWSRPVKASPTIDQLAGADRCEDEEERDEPDISPDDEEEAEEAESSPLFQQIVPETSDEVSVLHSERIDSSVPAALLPGKLPAMGDGELILPGKTLPAMTKEELEEKEEDGKEDE